MPGTADLPALLTDAVVTGTDDAIAALVGAGPRSVDQLCHHLSGESRIDAPGGTSDRLLLDNLTWVAHCVAEAFPDRFLEAFAGPRWSENPFVCAGLGAIRRPEATRRLMGILGDGTVWLRVAAAAGLRGHAHPELRATLSAARDDPDELVRYHVEERLAEIDGVAGTPSTD